MFFISRSQYQYQNKLKGNFKYIEVIILGDFAENFSFIVQDEIQECHWNKKQFSWYPIVLYYRKENKSDSTSALICFISDDLKHDVTFVCKLMKDTIKYIHDNLAEVLSKVIIFLMSVLISTKIARNF